MAKKKPIYNPNIKYGWDKDTKFSLNGNEFGLILNTFRTVLASPEAQKIILMNTANNTMEEMLKRSVESGIVKPAEIPDENPPMKVVK